MAKRTTVDTEQTKKNIHPRSDPIPGGLETRKNILAGFWLRNVRNNQAFSFSFG